MRVQIDIEYSIEAVLQELGQAAPSPDAEGMLLSTMHDKFFKGGGCEYYQPVPDDATDSEMAPRNIAVCMDA
jgi:hypothetical protein